MTEYASAERALSEHEEKELAKQPQTDTIKVSAGGPSVFFYVDLCSRYLRERESVHISGLGKGPHRSCPVLALLCLLSLKDLGSHPH